MIEDKGKPRHQEPAAERTKDQGPRTKDVRLVAIDLDGTLLNSRSEISPGNLQALRAAAELGVQIVIVTGRRFHSARPLIERIPCAVTLISSNGARIGTLSGELYHQDFLGRESAQQVIRVAAGYRPYAVGIFDIPGRGQVTMQENAVLEGPLGWYLKNSPGCLAQVPDLEAAIQSDPIQVMFGGPPQRMEPLEPLLRASSVAIRVQLTWTKYLTRSISILDVMNRGCSKGAAVELWAKRCGIDPHHVLAIGDNYNDLEMLQLVGYPVLMGNCCDGLGDRWPVTLSNDEDGVAAAIQQYVLESPG